MTSSCPECNTSLPPGTTCEAHFHQMLFWEHEFPELGAVHHLAVLGYYLQHPSLYSPEGLKHARQLLREFVENEVTPGEARRRMAAGVDSGQRDWKIKATAERQGSYPVPVKWTLTAADVVAGGPENYRQSVRRWAQSIHTTLQKIEDAHS
ncbi:MAG: hypothetical protein JXB38_12520 [Anaerolineales bacterium]|nr:hypothetical protein [Anaerolineales bacterium]